MFILSKKFVRLRSVSLFIKLLMTMMLLLLLMMMI